MEYSGANKLLGLEPTPPFSKDISDFIAKKKIQISNPNKDKGMTDEQYEKFLKRRNERLEYYLTQLKNKGLRNRNTDDASIQEEVKILQSRANEISKFEVIGQKPEEEKDKSIKTDHFEEMPFKKQE